MKSLSVALKKSSIFLKYFVNIFAVLAPICLMPKAVIKEGIKGSSGYSFAASGLLEIAEILRSGNVPDNFIVSSLGYGGYQSAAYISSVNT